MSINDERLVKLLQEFGIRESNSDTEMELRHKIIALNALSEIKETIREQYLKRKVAKPIALLLFADINVIANSVLGVNSPGWAMLEEEPSNRVSMSGRY